MAMLKSFLLLFIVFSMEHAEATKCPYGWTNFGLRCYKYFSQSVNWITAERNCQSLDANLPSIHNKLENDFLLSLVPSSIRCWAGAHDSVQEGQWLWTDGSVYEYTSWCSAAPDNAGGNENCLEVNWSSNRCWNDVPCSVSLNYFCVKDL